MSTTRPPLQLDRMAVEEVGLNPEKLAAEIHKQLALTCGPVPVHEIAHALDIVEIREERLSNLEGMLLTTPQRTNGSILVNKSSTYERRRFTIGHELGHFLITSHKPLAGEGFQCLPSDMIVGGDVADQNRQQEAEANRFASALLAPAHLVRRFVVRAPDLGQALEMAGELQISKEAGARRYTELHRESLATVYSRHGRIVYYAKGREFLALALRKGDQLPVDTILAVGQTSDMESVEAADWLRKPIGVELYAQTHFQKDGRSITLLHAEATDDVGLEDTYERFQGR